jgi:hypothetical protein
MAIKNVVICKIAFYLPNSKSRSSNPRHVQYIATRPEADRGDEAALRLGDEEPDRPDAAAHVEYAAERPGSSGLFGPDPERPPGWREVAADLARHSLPTWRLIVSLREEDAVRLGMTERKDWEPAIREGVQKAMEAMHLNPQSARWVAAFHEKQGHPHCHLVIWEEPHPGARRRGRLTPKEMRGVWRSFARELFRAERTRLAAEKAALRDLVRDLARGDVARAAELVREVRGMARLAVQALEGGRPGIPPTLRQPQLEDLASQLAALAGIMPGKGRAALAYMPEPVKARAREIADWLLRQPGFAQSAARYQELARELASHYTRKPEVLDRAGQKAYGDLRDRVAQQVVRAAALLERAVREDRAAQERMARSLWRAAWRGIERERLRAEAQAELASAREAARAEERAREERERGIGGR